jgi:hypothetical protein
MYLRTAVAIAGLCLAAACAEDGQRVLTSPEASFSADANSNGVVQSVSGSAHILIEAPVVGRRLMTVNAVKRADGSVSGRWRTEQQADGGNTFEGTVTCFTIIGNDAWLGGELTTLNGQPPAQRHAALFRLMDNGSGNDAPPDQSSTVGLINNPDYSLAYCDSTPDLPELPLQEVVQGNIQIRP